MIDRKKVELSTKQVEKARKQFDSWRRSRKLVSRIPENLWDLAVEAAREVGVNRAARALGLEYYALKKRVVSSANSSVLKPIGDANFVEFDSTGAPPFFTEWAVEMENDNGDRMRVAGRSPSGPDVVGLCRALWGAG